ncbi:hypothetical protein G3I28_34610, partial [Streptomyces sp. SID10116]|nr:hypothetical protein [Streptomyces sp. SID10116]
MPSPSPALVATPSPVAPAAATTPAVLPVPKDRRVRVSVTAPDPISREGVVSQLRRHPDVEVCGDAASASVTLFVEDTLDEAAL